jgi:hypothetical protein
MRPIRTGGIWFCLTNISTAKPAAASAQATRLVGQRWRQNYWRTLMILTERNTSDATARAKRPKYVARLAQSADEMRRAQRLRFEVFSDDTVSMRS